MQGFLNGLFWLISATVPAGRLLGIPLRVHLLMVVFLPFLAWALVIPGLGLLFNVIYTAAYIAILYLSVLAHEFGHAWGCRLVGGETDQIILTPVGGLHIGTGGNESPRTEFIVVALGPAVSILLTAIGWIAYTLAGNIPATNEWLILLGVCIYVFFAVNLMLTIFNLLFPLFPMDSARLIRAIFSLKHNPQLVTLRIAQAGVVLGVIILLAGILGLSVPFFGRVGFLLMIIAVLGIQVCLAEQKRIQYGPVYTLSDDWGQGPVYYDADVVSAARRRARADLARLLPFRRAPGPPRPLTPKKQKGPAKVIDVTPLTDPARLTDREALKEMIRKAVDREDFDTAAAAKKRLEELDEKKMG